MYMGVRPGYVTSGGHAASHACASRAAASGRRSPPPWWRSGQRAFPPRRHHDFATHAGGLTLARDWQSFALSPRSPETRAHPGSIGPGVFAAVRPDSGWAARFRGWERMGGHAALGGRRPASNPERRRTIRSEGTTSEWHNGASRGRKRDSRRSGKNPEAGVFRPELLPAEVTGPTALHGALHGVM